MVRSSGHHRKRSRSRSLTPDHKRSKSSRDYDKERARRRSRSRDRLRRSRSRDRTKDKKFSESRVRSKPLKLKRRSRSRSRSKSKEKIAKKDDKKEIKEDEPFDPTNLDKVPGREDDEEWVVTDVIEDGGVDDNGDPEEEYDYEADEDDRYSRRSTSSHDSHHSSSHGVQGETSADVSKNKDDIPHEESTNKENNITSTSSELNYASDVLVIDEVSTNENGKARSPSLEKDNLKDVVSRIQEISSLHKTNMNSLSSSWKCDRCRRSHTYERSKSDFKYSEAVERRLKDQIRDSMRYDNEFHNLRVKNEIARHKAELEVIKIQLDYWKKKHAT